MWFGAIEGRLILRIPRARSWCGNSSWACLSGLTETIRLALSSSHFRPSMCQTHLSACLQNCKGTGKKTQIDIVQVVVVKQQLFLQHVRAVRWFSVHVILCSGFCWVLPCLKLTFAGVRFPWLIWKYWAPEVSIAVNYILEVNEKLGHSSALTLPPSRGRLLSCVSLRQIGLPVSVPAPCHLHCVCPHLGTKPGHIRSGQLVTSEWYVSLLLTGCSFSLSASTSSIFSSFLLRPYSVFKR